MAIYFAKVQQSNRVQFLRQYFEPVSNYIGDIMVSSTG
jgi:hypothetical protein